jgi:hypothetical protein
MAQQTRRETYEIQEFDGGYAGFHVVYVNHQCVHCYKVTKVKPTFRFAQQALNDHLAQFHKFEKRQ